MEIKLRSRHTWVHGDKIITEKDKYYTLKEKKHYFKGTYELKWNISGSYMCVDDRVLYICFYTVAEDREIKINKAISS
jgi:hypothetical protein